MKLKDVEVKHVIYFPSDIVLKTEYLREIASSIEFNSYKKKGWYEAKPVRIKLNADDVISDMIYSLRDTYFNSVDYFVDDAFIGNVPPHKIEALQDVLDDIFNDSSIANVVLYKKGRKIDLDE